MKFERQKELNSVRKQIASIKKMIDDLDRRKDLLQGKIIPLAARQQMYLSDQTRCLSIQKAQEESWTPEMNKHLQSCVLKLHNAIRTQLKAGNRLVNYTSELFIGFIDKGRKKNVRYIGTKSEFNPLDAILLQNKVPPVVMGGLGYFDRETTITLALGVDSEWTQAFEAGWAGKSIPKNISLVKNQKVHDLGMKFRKQYRAQLQQGFLGVTPLNPSQSKVVSNQLNS